ncbi:FabD/lysophospholipase-like protein [Aaosphaeria arxii CBS 175.79]|uniref:FabD/lysophospholipase-like protein n=1 Tax=Aaosphaeria arxii CBS 175.79 TaxID=1450172 RepID=A0A6A5XQ19_9PLEO|nr:FabD/lysophospholipase-like protein [Aaosphaeria arxii CBS 175.79]KAF2015348.1 FabD/lysophospholipase-like protein [Aaosphaeria arxii CBS 175.79]
MSGSNPRLLSLDGGGVRGLSALLILERLMETVNPDDPPKPCDYFDMIGGTSTGGLIAIMLGRLKMSVADCIKAYLSLSDRVFKKKAHRVTIKGMIQGRFDSDELVRAIKEVIKQQGLPEDTLLKDAPDARCKVFVCATSRETKDTVCLTSYRPLRGISNLWNSVTIWEACRATSAASSFFDPIVMGQFREEFVDGATGANNPVREVWDQAQLVWEPELESKVKCLVSIGTGIPSLKPFKDDAFHIHKTLVAISTETEQTAERFRREKAQLHTSGRYYRFNVDRGLEDIGLEEATKVKEIAAATRRFVSSQQVYEQMQAYAGNIASREHYVQYRIPFTLKGAPRVRHFVDRPAEMRKLENVLLPTQKHTGRETVYVLRGMGGIGKTQLAVEFAHRHHHQFSAVLWLDEQSKDSIKRSIASCAERILQGQIPDTNRVYAAGGNVDVEGVIKKVMGWLARKDNTAWLLIFDNVDREYKKQGGDTDAYDVRQYFPGASHGSILITTRLAKLEQLGDSQHLEKVDQKQAQDILENCYDREHGTAESKKLLELLDGLPLAISQAGAYLRQSAVGVKTYLKFYEQEWNKLMGSDDWADEPLLDYPGRSIWTTWVISYQAVLEKHEATAKLLLLWSCLDNGDLWYELFAAACQRSTAVGAMLLDWIGDIATSELAFTNAMQLLRSYSLVDTVEELGRYATHPVVHIWALHFQGKCFASDLKRLAVVVVGSAVPDESTRDCWIMQRRLLPQAQVCSVWIVDSQIEHGTEVSREFSANNGSRAKTLLLLEAMHRLGLLYQGQDKLAEAELLYTRVLKDKEEALGPNHVSIFDTANNLGLLYTTEGKLAEGEAMYIRALQGKEEVLGPKNTSTLDTVGNLGILYHQQGKLAEAEAMYTRALQGKEEAFGTNHTPALVIMSNLGELYVEQGKLAEAEALYTCALQGSMEALGLKHISTLAIISNLGKLYARQNKLVEAEEMYTQALQGKEEVLGLNHRSTRLAFVTLGKMYFRQKKMAEAADLYNRALHIYDTRRSNYRLFAPVEGTVLLTQQRPRIATMNEEAYTMDLQESVRLPTPLEYSDSRGNAGYYQ